MCSAGLGLACGAALVLSLCDAVSGELCYVDSTTGSGVYCEPNCCGSNPTYCCDKQSFIVRSAVFGSLGVFFVVCMITCFVCKRVKKAKKKAAMKEAEAKMKAARASKPTVSVISSSAASGGVVNEGFSASEQFEGGADSQSPAQPSGSPNPDISLREISPSTSPLPNDAQVTPPPSDAMYSQQHYPPPATPTIPHVIHVSQSSQAPAEPSAQEP